MDIIRKSCFWGTRTGTHMDAPFHFNANAPAIDQIEIKRFICDNALLLKIQKDSNQMITGDDILNNSKYEIKEKDTVVFSTGWEKGFSNQCFCWSLHVMCIRNMITSVNGIHLLILYLPNSRILLLLLIYY